MLKKACITGLVLAAALAGPAAAQEKKTLKFAVFTPDTEMTFTTVMKPFAERVMKDSHGTLEIKLYPNGALGRNPGKQLKMVQDGVADIAWVIPAYTPGRFPDNAVFELPALIQNSKEGSIAAWRLYKKGLLRGYEDFYVIGLFTSSPYTIHTKEKVTSMADLKGKKIRAVGPEMVASIKALGAAPEAMPFTKIVEAMSRGRIDGTTGHPIAVYDFGVSKVAMSHYFGHLGTVNLAIMMNRKVYEGLPPVAKAALDKNSGEALSVAFGNMSDTRNAELRGIWAKDKHRTVTIPSAAETKKWNATLAPVVDAWIKKHKNGKRLVTALKTELANIRAGK
jgi:TRAP-type C4-dicarboxylate transport system substrate-binding protein